MFVARAFVLAVRRFPEINARWDEAAAESVIQHYVNQRMAAGAPRGLMVPNIKDSDQLDLTGLAHAVDALVQTARSGKTSPEEMSNGTITITNIGALGVDAGTPILNLGGGPRSWRSAPYERSRGLTMENCSSDNDAASHIVRPSTRGRCPRLLRARGSGPTAQRSGRDLSVCVSPRYEQAGVESGRVVHGPGERVAIDSDAVIA